MIYYPVYAAVYCAGRFFYYSRPQFGVQERGERKMAGISRYEKIVLGLTAGFLLFTGGWFLASSRTAQPYTVTVQRQEEEPALPAAEQETPEEPERPDSLLEGEVIDLNTADLYDLCRLPGIGEKRAQAIIAWREEHGPFQAADELTNISGIGPKILEGLRDYVTTGSE